MAEKIDQDKCRICLSDYKQPKILDCQHSFCQICLEDYVHRTSSNGHFQCPLCRSDATLPEGDVKNLPSKPTNDPPRCGFTDGCENGSSFRCRDCDQNLCRSCRRTHDSLKVFKGHAVVSWDEPGPKIDKPETQPVQDERDLCPCGKGKMVEYLCEDCSKCVCFTCCFNDHNGHKLKDLQDEDVKQQITDEMVSLNDKLKRHINRLSEFREIVKTKKTGVAATVEEICGKIDVHVQKVCDEVTKIGENIKEDVKKIYLQDEENASSTTSDITSFNKLLEDIEISTENMKAGVKSSTIVLDERSIVQKVERLDQLRQEVKDCGSSKMVMPDVPVMEFVAGEIDRDVLRKQVGRFGREGMFEVYFSIDEVVLDPFNSREVEYGDLTWSVRVDRGLNGIVGIGLNLIKTPRTPCKVDYSIKLVYIYNGQKSVIKHQVKTFTEYDKTEWMGFLPWSELTGRHPLINTYTLRGQQSVSDTFTSSLPCDPLPFEPTFDPPVTGFVDDNQFKVQVTLKQVCFNS